MKVVLITGGSSGIGKSIGEFLHQKGYKVYGTTRKLNAQKSLFTLKEMDVRNQETIQKLIDDILNTEGKIDVLINNAGVGITGPIEETPTAEMRNNFEVNFFGPIEVIKAVLPSMRKNKSGLIINITSIAGYMGLPFRGIYSASKGALEVVTEALSMEVKSLGIKICNVAPGDFATNIAQGRYHAPVIDGSDYQNNYQTTLNMMNEHVDLGSNPDQMAHAIFQIINSQNTKIHYKVGAFMQKFSIVLKRILPDRMYEKILMNHYKMN